MTQVSGITSLFTRFPDLTIKVQLCLMKLNTFEEPSDEKFIHFVLKSIELSRNKSEMDVVPLRMCPENCSGHGICSILNNGTCVCEVNRSSTQLDFSNVLYCMIQPCILYFSFYHPGLRMTMSQCNPVPGNK